MPLQILTNTALRDAAKLSVTNSSNTELAPNNIDNIAGGPRHYVWDAATTGVRRLNYVNTGAIMQANTVVVTRADLANGYAVSALAYSTYPGTSSSAYSTTVALGNLVGQKGQDLVASFNAVSGMQALGVQFGTSPTDESTITARTGKVYFCNAYTLNYPGAVSYQPLPLDSRFSVFRQSYLVNETWKFTADGLTKSDVQGFEQLYRLQEEPVFIWDAAGTLVSYNLIHGIIADYDLKADFDNTHSLTFTVQALKSWT